MSFLSRRDLLVGGATLTASSLALPHLAKAAAPFVQPPLPYADDALSPVIGAQTVQLHYGRHHAGYFTALNRLVENTRYASMDLVQVCRESFWDPQARGIANNAGQAWNHIIYWDQFKPGGPTEPQARLKELVERDFGSVQMMKDKLQAAAVGQFGAGWGWLVQTQDGKLDTLATPNGDTPLPRGLRALVGIDVWEHAYYLDYQNRRADHVKAVLDRLVNWSVVGERLG